MSRPRGAQPGERGLGERSPMSQPRGRTPTQPASQAAHCSPWAHCASPRVLGSLHPCLPHSSAPLPSPLRTAMLASCLSSCLVSDSNRAGARGLLGYLLCVSACPLPRGGVPEGSLAVVGVGVGRGRRASAPPHPQHGHHSPPVALWLPGWSLELPGCPSPPTGSWNRLGQGEGLGAGSHQAPSAWL